MIRFLLDMGLPRTACDDLQQRGIDAVHVGALGLFCASDPDVIQFAVREGRVIVTLTVTSPSSWRSREIDVIGDLHSSERRPCLRH